MLIVMKHGARTEQIDEVVRVIEEMGYEARPIPGKQRVAIGLIGNDGRVDEGRLVSLAGVREVIPVTQPYKQVSREWREEPTIIELPNGTTIGDREVALMAGPCSVESADQIMATAAALKEAGATVLRGGAFKPRTSPYAFQGLGETGLKLLAQAREETGLAIVTEALDSEGALLVAEYADVVQIGARNMQNYSLLRAAGRAGKPVLLKRGMSATVRELLLAAEYILNEGEPRVILCERGLRSFDDHARNLLDLTAVVSVQEMSHLPIVVDPSHGTGNWRKVPAMARAAIAAGADGLLIEVHPDPSKALSDGAQSLRPDRFADLIGELRTIARAIGRDLVPPVI